MIWSEPCISKIGCKVPNIAAKVAPGEGGMGGFW